MNILYISPNVEQTGAERSLVSLMKYQRDTKKNQVMLVIQKPGPIEELLNDENLSYLVFRFHTWINLAKGNRILIGLIKLILNYFRSVKLKHTLKQMGFIPDIVHTNVITTEFGFQCSQRIHCRHIWHIREFGKLDFNFDFDLGNTITHWIFKMSGIFTANSNAVKKYYDDTFPKLNIVTVYNGIPVYHSLKHVFHKNSFKFVMAGRLGKEKRQEDAIRAIVLLHDRYQVKNVTLDIFGTGIEQENLQCLIESNHANEYIHLRGFAKNINYQDYNFGLMCTEYEAFGRVTIEYMMAGLVVFGADAGGTHEILTPETGVLYKPCDFEDLAHKINEVISNDLLCEQISIHAVRRVINNFSLNRYCEDIFNVYSKALSKC